jgi:hypothetical protein
VVTSSDGINWTPCIGRFTDGCFSVAYGGGRWVAVGTDSSSKRIITSIDGIIWSSASGTIFQGDGKSVAYYGIGRWVAVGSDLGGSNSIVTSTDGINWVSVLGTTFIESPYFVSYGGGRWVATAYDTTNSVLTSLNGVTWKPVSGQKFSVLGYMTVYSSVLDRWVLVGQTSETNQPILYSI